MKAGSGPPDRGASEPVGWEGLAAERAAPSGTEDGGGSSPPSRHPSAAIATTRRSTGAPRASGRRIAGIAIPPLPVDREAQDALSVVEQQMASLAPQEEEARRPLHVAAAVLLDEIEAALAEPLEALKPVGRLPFVEVRLGEVGELEAQADTGPGVAQ